MSNKVIIFVLFTVLMFQCTMFGMEKFKHAVMNAQFKKARNMLINSPARHQVFQEAVINVIKRMPQYLRTVRDEDQENEGLRLIDELLRHKIQEIKDQEQVATNALYVLMSGLNNFGDLNDVQAIVRIFKRFVNPNLLEKAHQEIKRRQWPRFGAAKEDNVKKFQEFQGIFKARFKDIQGRIVYLKNQKKDVRPPKMLYDVNMLAAQLHELEKLAQQTSKLIPDLEGFKQALSNAWNDLKLLRREICKEGALEQEIDGMHRLIQNLLKNPPQADMLEVISRMGSRVNELPKRRLSGVLLAKLQWCYERLVAMHKVLSTMRILCILDRTFLQSQDIAEIEKRGRQAAQLLKKNPLTPFWSKMLQANFKRLCYRKKHIDQGNLKPIIAGEGAWYDSI